MRRYQNENCTACFIRGCNCECATCVFFRERNIELTQYQLDQLSLIHAMSFKEDETHSQAEKAQVQE